MLYMTSSGMYVYNSKHIQTERYGGTHYKIVSTLPSLYSNVALSLVDLLFIPPLFISVQYNRDHIVLNIKMILLVSQSHHT